MQQILQVDNSTVDTPLKTILEDVKTILGGKKLKDIIDKGDELIITCPNLAHANGQEKSPDHHINIGKSDVPYGTTNCFACGAHGSFVNFIALCFDSSIDYAKQWLIKRYGVLSHEVIKMDDEINLQKTEKRYLDESLLDQYQKWCPYFAKRKLGVDVCEAFNLRYDPYYRQVIFPIYDVKGRLVMLAKRSIETKTFYMDEDQEKPVYCLNNILDNNISSCMIVEGLFDCITCWDRGVPAIATLGAPSPDQIKLINKSCINVLYVAFDNDAAGRKFNAFLKKYLSPRILTVDIRLPANRKDVNDLTIEEWRDLIKNQIDPQNPSEIIV